MLTSLTIQNVVLIEKLTIAFDRGLCALTGETGAGKSILLDALGLALGARSESALVRKGADKAQVTAVFEGQNAAALRLLEEANLDSSDDTLILRRIVSADGRSKAYINDQPVSIGLLKQIGETLVEIHGQFSAQGLLDPSTHRGLLDEYAGVNSALKQSWEEWNVSRETFEQMQEKAQKSRADEKYLRQALEDLDALNPQIGEENELAALRERLMSRERVLESLNAAYEALNGEQDPVRMAWSALDRVIDKLGEAAEAITGPLDRAAAEIQEAIAQIQSLSADLEHADHNLESIDERLHTLRLQARKHECAPDDLAAKREELAADLNAIEHADDILAEQARKVEQARKAYIASAEEARAQRQKAGAQLDALVQKELAPLKLDKARFTTQIEKLPEEQWGASGMDRVRFLVATNPGAEPGPLHKIASGGEMSRFMLALKVVMSETGTAGTLIFDEVDAGIGGGAADAVGERLARLAGGKQILVVTHSPQVAARASHHYIVRKGGTDEVTTDVTPLSTAGERREEIARMLAGATITEEARAAADKLLEVAA